MFLSKEKKLMDGKRLRALRLSKKLTQEELGKIIHVSKVSISGYESGDRTPDTENIGRLADFFEVSSDYLLGRTDKLNSTDKVDNFDPMTEINNLLKKYDIDQSGFFDIEKWKAMGPDEIRELESYFEFITNRAREKNKTDN